ncbi:MAG TPA: metallophosphoesterase, partial [Leucothrix mucor]|nr:metallophosphoesterase [Leucothrix mucor]
MKLTFISDTHYQHNKLQLDSGDVLIHSGDFTRRGGLDEVANFAEFIAAQDFKTKIVIAG